MLLLRAEWLLRPKAQAILDAQKLRDEAHEIWLTIRIKKSHQLVLEQMKGRNAKIDVDTACVTSQLEYQRGDTVWAYSGTFSDWIKGTIEDCFASSSNVNLGDKGVRLMWDYAILPRDVSLDGRDKPEGVPHS